MSDGFWFNEESMQKKVLRLLKEKAEKLGRLPTWEEVKQDEQMPNPNEYSYYYGTFDQALSRVATMLGMKFDYRRLSLPAPNHSDLDRQFMARVEERVKAKSMAQHAKEQAVKDQIAREKLALSTRPAISAMTLPKTTMTLTKEEKSMEDKNYSVDPGATEENGSVSIAEEAREATEVVEVRNDAELIATEAVEAVEAENDVETVVAEANGDDGADQPTQSSGKGKGRRYTRVEIINLLRRAREERGGKIPSQAEFKKIDYLPSWATVTRVLGPFTGWPAILDGTEVPSEAGGVGPTEKAQSRGRVKVAHRSEEEIAYMLQQARKMDVAVAMSDAVKPSEMTEEPSPRAMKVTLEFLNGEVRVQATKNVKIELATDDGEHFSVGLRW